MAEYLYLFKFKRVKYSEENPYKMQALESVPVRITLHQYKFASWSR